jgi:hypothetical protein
VFAFSSQEGMSLLLMAVVAVDPIMDSIGTSSLCSFRLKNGLDAHPLYFFSCTSQLVLFVLFF